jgi:hypothetical protein
MTVPRRQRAYDPSACGGDEKGVGWTALAKRRLLQCEETNGLSTVAAPARRSRMVEMEKAERDYEFLRQCFCEVLHEIGESEVAQVLSPAAEAGAAIHSQAAAQAQSIAFQL